MPIWRNMPSMPKVRASSGTIGTTCGPMSLSLTQDASRMRTSAMVVEISRSPDASSSGAKASSAGDRERRRSGAALRQVAAERLAPLAAGIRAPRCPPPAGSTARCAMSSSETGMLKRSRNALQRLVVELLLLVRDVLALAGLAHAVALDRLGEDHGRLALVRRPPRRRRRRPCADRGRRDSGARCRRRTCWRPSPAARGTCRRSARACRRRPWP